MITPTDGEEFGLSSQQKKKQLRTEVGSILSARSTILGATVSALQVWAVSSSAFCSLRWIVDFGVVC